MTSAKKDFTSQRGFSLVSALVGIGVSAIVMLVTSVAIFNLSESKRKMDLQSQLDLFHLQSLQILGNQEILQILFYNGNPQLELCFQRKGSNCNSLNKSTIQPKDPSDKYGLNKLEPIHPRKGFSCTNPNSECVFQRKAEMTVFCSSSDFCEKVIINVDTQFVGPKNPNGVRNHHTELVYAARSDQQRHIVDFSCSSTGVFISGIDFKGLIAKCDPLPNSNLSCSGSMPLVGVGPLAPTGCFPNPVSAGCGSTGLARTGLYSGAEGCTVTAN
ncbi:type II secretion system protein J [Bdellovibrio sp.]|uniref:PulJ/GspJ family protein n=1 Tax=Bdellovibrio sp. TaxID=28201 RepID=UPI0039E26C7E